MTTKINASVVGYITSMTANTIRFTDNENTTPNTGTLKFGNGNSITLTGGDGKNFQFNGADVYAESSGLGKVYAQLTKNGALDKGGGGGTSIDAQNIQKFLNGTNPDGLPAAAWPMAVSEYNYSRTGLAIFRNYDGYEAVGLGGSGISVITAANTANNRVRSYVACGMTPGIVLGTNNAGDQINLKISGSFVNPADHNYTSAGTFSNKSIGTPILYSSVVYTASLRANSVDGNDTTTGTIQGTWSLSSGATFAATYADLAEKYTTDAAYEPGTVLVFGGDKEVTVTTQTMDRRVAGVVSTNPAYSMNDAIEGVLIALQGRVPCKVIGTIKKGDMLITSGIEGVATSSDDPKLGSVIGKALENYDSQSIGVIEVAIGRA